MSTIASAIERLETLVGCRDGFGVGTHRSVTSLTEGLRCSTEEGAWCTDSDLPAAMGGTSTAPTPGVLLRAALGSCMAMSYRLRAAKHGVELTSVRVTVEADAEIAGMLMPDASAYPGFSEIRYHVDVESPAPESDVMRILDEGDRLSPLLDVFTRSNAVRRTTVVRVGGG